MMPSARYIPSSRLFAALGILALLSAACFIWDWVIYLWLAGLLTLSVGIIFDIWQLSRSRISLLKTDWNHQPTMQQSFKWKLTMTLNLGKGLRLTLTNIENDIFIPTNPLAEIFWFPNNTINAYWDMLPTQRGQWTWPGTLARMTTPLMLFEKWQLMGKSKIPVYPRILTDSRYSLNPPFLMTMLGTKLNRFRRADQEFESLRPYLNGDNYRYIDWKASSRSTGLITRQYQMEQHHQILVCLDVSRMMGTLAEGYSKLDWSIEACLHLAYLSAYFKDQLGVLAFSNQVHEWVHPRQQSVSAILNAVYNLKAQTVEADFHNVCLNVLAHQKKRSLVIFLSDFLDAGSLEPSLAAFAQLNRKHCGLFVGVEDPALQAYLGTAKSDTPIAVAKTMVAQDAMRNREVVLKQLQKQGLRAITVTPKNLVQRAMQAYLEIKSLGAI